MMLHLQNELIEPNPSYFTCVYNLHKERYSAYLNDFYLWQFKWHNITTACGSEL